MYLNITSAFSKIGRKIVLIPSQRFVSVVVICFPNSSKSNSVIKFLKVRAIGTIKAFISVKIASKLILLPKSITMVTKDLKTSPNLLKSIDFIISPTKLPILSKTSLKSFPTSVKSIDFIKSPTKSTIGLKKLIIPVEMVLKSNPVPPSPKNPLKKFLSGFTISLKLISPNNPANTGLIT